MLPDARTAAGRVAVIAVIGLGLGVTVGGVLGRLAMFLLARTSSAAAGMRTDDGFTIGRFTLGGTLHLLAVAGALGLIGGLIYAAVRPLQFHGRGARIICTALAAGIGVGSLIVNATGVDFRVLRPTWLAVSLFVAIPALYGGLLSWIVEGRPRRRQFWAEEHPTWQWGLRMASATIGVLCAVSLWGDVSRLT